MSAGPTALGVDLGGTTTTAAVYRDGRVDTLKLDPADDALPMAVQVDGDPASWVVGTPAVRAAAGGAPVARRFTSCLGQRAPLVVDGVSVQAEDLVARVLAHVLGVAGEALGGPPAHVTLTHPAHWGPHTLGVLRVVAEELAIADAGLVDDLTAIATHYVAEHRVAAGTLLAAWDLGGSSVEVAVLRRTTGGFELAGPPGVSEALAGDAFDRRLTDHLGRRLGEAWTSADPFDSATARAMAQLQERAQAAKAELSTALHADVAVVLGAASADVRVTRREYEELVGPIIDGVLDLLADTVDEAGVAVDDLAGVVLGGGSSRTPLVAARLSERFGTLPLLRGDPRYAASLGAAVTAAVTAAASAGMTRALPRPEPVVPRRQEPDATLTVDVAAQGLADSTDRRLVDVPLVPAVEVVRRRITPVTVVPVKVDDMQEVEASAARLLLVAAGVLVALVALIVVLSLVT